MIIALIINLLFSGYILVRLFMRLAGSQVTKADWESWDQISSIYF